MRARVPSYLGHSVLHDLLVRHITLVAYKQLVNALGGVAVDLLQPLLDVVERIHVRHIVDHTDAVGAAVVRRGDGSETLLARGIPLLYLSAFPFRCSEITLDPRSAA